MVVNSSEQILNPLQTSLNQVAAGVGVRFVSWRHIGGFMQSANPIQSLRKAFKGPRNSSNDRPAPITKHHPITLTAVRRRLDRLLSRASCEGPLLGVCAGTHHPHPSHPHLVRTTFVIRSTSSAVRSAPFYHQKGNPQRAFKNNRAKRLGSSRAGSSGENPDVRKEVHRHGRSTVI